MIKKKKWSVVFRELQTDGCGTRTIKDSEPYITFATTANKACSNAQYRRRMEGKICLPCNQYLNGDGALIRFYVATEIPLTAKV